MVEFPQSDAPTGEHKGCDMKQDMQHEGIEITKSPRNCLLGCMFSPTKR